MPSLIEKITLYDILGYCIPGSILIGLSGAAFLLENGGYKSFYDTYKESIGYGLLVLLVLGYVAGMLIAEITDIIIRSCKETLNYDVKEELRVIDFKCVEQALKKAKYISKDMKLRGVEDVLKYISGMYGDIQSDIKYNRIHNYSSSKLVCKNLAFVSFCGFLIVLNHFIQSFELMFCSDVNILKVILVISGWCVAGILFIRRWKKNYIKTNFYTVIWFIDKYNTSEKE